MAKPKKKTSKSSKKAQKKLSIKKKIKTFCIFLIMMLLGACIYFNSSYFNSYREEVYAQIKEAYIENTEEKGEAVAEKTVNYTLTVDQDLREPSNLSEAEIEALLEGTGLVGLGATFVEAEATYSVNSLYLVGLACVESAYGNSTFATERNNLFGWRAYDSDTSKASYFSTKEECIMFVAERLHTNYLTEGGTWFEGYSAASVDVHYCSDPDHASKIVNVVNKELLPKLAN